MFLPLLVPPDAWASLTRPPLPEPGPFVRTAHAASTCDPQDSATAAVTLYRVRLAWLWPGVIRATVAPEPLCTRAASSALDLIRAAERDPKTPYPGVFRKANVGYDELGRLATVSVHKQQGVVLTQPEVTTYAYTEVGSRESMSLPNGVTTLYEYDNLNRLTNLSHFNAADALLASFTYTLAPTGRRTGVDEQVLQANDTLAATAIQYTYDQLNRLTQEASTSDLPEATFTTDYSYDLVGNRLAKATTRNQDGVAESITYACNNNDQLITETSSLTATKGTTTYAYNENGSLISKTNGTTGESVSYSYNLENRLIAADIARVEKDSQGASHQVAISSSYQYDQSGIRTKAQSTTRIAGQAPYDTTRIFLNDAQNFTGYSQVLEELPVLGVTPTVSYNFGDDHISQTAGSTTSFFAMDGHGSTRLLTDSTGGITDRLSFDAYGCQLGPESNVVNPAATSLLYSGEAHDFELDMQYLRARYYDQGTGTFASLDPFGGNNEDPQSLHKYSYCGADGVNGVDPTGSMTIAEVISVVGIILSVTTAMLSGYKIGQIMRLTHEDEYTVRQAMYQIGVEAGQLGFALLGGWLLGHVLRFCIGAFSLAGKASLAMRLVQLFKKIPQLGVEVRRNYMAGKYMERLYSFFTGIRKNTETFGGSIPDFVRSGVWDELKYYPDGIVSGSSQFTKMVRAAIAKGVRLNLHVPPGTEVTAPLDSLIASTGGAVIYDLPVISPAVYTTFYAAVDDVVDDYWP